MDRKKHAAIFVRMIATHEIPAAKKIKRLLISQGNKIADAYKKSGEHVIDKIINEGHNELARLLIAIYTASGKDFADYTLEQIGEKALQKKGIHLSNFLRLMTSFIHHEALTRSAIINDTSKTIIKRVLKKGNEAGLGQDEIAKKIKNKVKSISDFRSRTIARTEVHNAATYASQEIAQQSDQDLMREWVAVDDDRTREDHADADGQQRSMDDPFDVGGEELDRPGDGDPENSINCRCSVIYIPKGLANL